MQSQRERMSLHEPSSDPSTTEPSLSSPDATTFIGCTRSFSANVFQSSGQSR